MSSNLLTVAADDGLLLTWELMTQAGVHHVPILDGGRCVGVVDAATLALECVRDPLGHHHRLVREVVPPSTPHVSDDTPVEAVAHELLATRATAVLVSNPQQQLVGLITVHDLLKVLANETTRHSTTETVTSTTTLFRLTPLLPCVIDVPTEPADCG
jgi:predicted transcriptional regulator